MSKKLDRIREHARDLCFWLRDDTLSYVARSIYALDRFTGPLPERMRTELEVLLEEIRYQQESRLEVAIEEQAAAEAKT